MINRPSIYRAEALAQQENTEEFEHVVQLVHIPRWLVVLLLISLIVLLIFGGLWLFGYSTASQTR